ncbi:MAG: stage IV sporulation protein A [Clostridia bacterium]|nr:stage IV sporulation protein A [Clostridia bacterium]
MTDNSIYSDIAKRTGGDIYVGVVGPVRTGKSTFIQRFLDCVVLPNIEDEYDRQRTQDETPQSASGKTVMTTEPKFVPDDSVRITVGDGTGLNVKLIDCVGYMVDGALGALEEGVPRMVMTPWRDEPIPFPEAAELGTEKVIGEHSTIGMLVTTDGSFGDIPRESYEPAERRVAEELRALGKPFAIVLNSAKPNTNEARALAQELEECYGAPVALVSCPDLSADDICGILELVLGEFPLRRLDFSMPEWCEVLPEDHRLRAELIERIHKVAKNAVKLGEVSRAVSEIEGVEICSLDAGEGTGMLELPVSDEEYYEVLGELTGFDISDKKKLFTLLMELSEIKTRYEGIKDALDEVEEKGYGIVMPSPKDMTLEEPKVVKTANGCGVSISARAESIHMIKTGIRAELCPMVGTEEQTEGVVKYLKEDLASDPSKIWESNMFGKSLYDLVKDGMNAKLSHMPDESRAKLGETIEKIINDGASGLICILL